ncbi:hypothetical protein RHMOL_Rhmol05G0121300 [Rhododendron molle]|uniref:Uncharacterized protein n=5 Tax=Rhododendron molle TaxID=49168 RepID=A0ACC0NPB3_RHOML|nr:hypothetical protein RHMOL_Rhmol05G0121300 [Rhododendron molle]KAI8554736.1 hypothetical protein RHMOL_Rhmol05G0121300 [Rhododendron molle]KAI8554737.1 hypothetical protein RHMOL_Rhmol05G0121300 [Rhododendron molle]KAI8554738.1 hypothetical protein RHMOL_Rhmol05G0121300 [Rhododendron molle]KAI8554739.1 hypothetical protein RHMOL_Rhmol05G0121300 [Rhododendron molle]
MWHAHSERFICQPSSQRSLSLGSSNAKTLRSANNMSLDLGGISVCALGAEESPKTLSTRSLALASSVLDPRYCILSSSDGFPHDAYEESRLKRPEENKKRMEELNLNKLTQALSTPTPKVKFT